MQNRVLRSLPKKEKIQCSRGCPPRFGHRTQLELSCPAARRLSECPKKKEYYLGGWRARDSDTYTRVAVRVGIQMGAAQVSPSIFSKGN